MARVIVIIVISIIIILIGLTIFSIFGIANTDKTITDTKLLVKEKPGKTEFVEIDKPIYITEEIPCPRCEECEVCDYTLLYEEIDYWKTLVNELNYKMKSLNYTISQCKL